MERVKHINRAWFAFSWAVFALRFLDPLGFTCLASLSLSGSTSSFTAVGLIASGDFEARSGDSPKTDFDGDVGLGGGAAANVSVC